MTSRDPTPIEMDNSASQASAAASRSIPTNAFGRMMQPKKDSPSPAAQLRDRCKRPTPEYNYNYNPNKSPPDTQPAGYSPYVYGEPLFDDREAVVANLPKKHVLAPAPKKPRTAWVWALGYALVDSSKATKIVYWACKHCTYLVFL
jgi:hypothetical protein